MNVDWIVSLAIFGVCSSDTKGKEAQGDNQKSAVNDAFGKASARGVLKYNYLSRWFLRYIFELTSFFMKAWIKMSFFDAVRSYAR